jgi:hypothetical protein
VSHLRMLRRDLCTGRSNGQCRWSLSPPFRGGRVETLATTAGMTHAASSGTGSTIAMTTSTAGHRR